MNIDNLSDAELATCVDEYVKRAMLLADLGEVTCTVSVQIYASRYGSDSMYDITHTAAVGGYNSANNVRGNNAIAGMRKCVDRWGADRVEQPTKVRPMLAAPVRDNSDIPF